MKHRWPWVMGIGCMGIALVCVLNGQARQALAAEAAKDQGTAPKAASAEKEKIVYTFTDESKMTDFTNLWRQRQGVILRMTVLQSYWNEEQAGLKQLNDKFTTDYKLDVTKNYVLDDKRRVLIEREAPTPPESGAKSGAGASGESIGTPK